MGLFFGLVIGLISVGAGIESGLKAIAAAIVESTKIKEGRL